MIAGFAARLEVLAHDDEAAAHSGQLRAELARSRGLILVTNNRCEFERVPGLRIEDWL